MTAELPTTAATANLRVYPTWLPVFPGFYNSSFDGSDNWCEQQDCLTDDEFRESYPKLSGVPRKFFAHALWDDGVSFAGSRVAVVKRCCEALRDMLPDHVKDVAFTSIKSPREYNFHNDAVYCDITVDQVAVREYLLQHADALAVYLKRRYSHRDGFISFHPNNVQEWKELTHDFTDFSENMHYCGALLSFIAANEFEDPEEEMLQHFLLDEVWDNNVIIDEDAIVRAWERFKAKVDSMYPTRLCSNHKRRNMTRFLHARLRRASSYSTYSAKHAALVLTLGKKLGLPHTHPLLRNLPKMQDS